jgi:serine/threonine protein kinase
MTGARFGQWTLCGESKIGSGGNGVVWLAQNATGETAAIKLLHPHFLEQKKDGNGPRRIARFYREIEFLRRYSGRPGILPRLDDHCPDLPTTSDSPWLAMPLAIEISKAIPRETRTLAQIIMLLASIARTLATLHDEGINHRDIKPENLFILNGKGVIGDFGLVDLPGQPEITREGEQIGDRNYRAPELDQNPSPQDARPADVWAFAKSLWVLGTGQRFPPPGEQRIDTPAVTLSAYVADRKANLLDRLIERCTSIDPTRRPTMRSVAEELDAWCSEPSSSGELNGLSQLGADIAPLLSRFQRRTEAFKVIHDSRREIIVDLTARLEQLAQELRLSTSLRCEVEGNTNVLKNCFCAQDKSVLGEEFSLVIVVHAPYLVMWARMGFILDKEASATLALRAVQGVDPPIRKTWEETVTVDITSAVGRRAVDVLYEKFKAAIPATMNALTAVMKAHDPG